jgi:hypothetical protein
MIFNPNSDQPFGGSGDALAYIPAGKFAFCWNFDAPTDPLNTLVPKSVRLFDDRDSSKVRWFDQQIGNQCEANTLCTAMELMLGDGTVFDRPSTYDAMLERDWRPYGPPIDPLTGQRLGIKQFVQGLRAVHDGGVLPVGGTEADANKYQLKGFERLGMGNDTLGECIVAMACGIRLATTNYVDPSIGACIPKDLGNGVYDYDFEGSATFYNFPQALFGKPNAKRHAMAVVGYDLEADGRVYVYVVVGQDWKPQGMPVIRITWETFLANAMEIWAPRQIGDRHWPINPQLLALPNYRPDPDTFIPVQRHSAEFMRNLRYVVYNILNAPGTQSQHANEMRRQMPLFGVDAQDLADAGQPFGITLDAVNQFLSIP